MFLKCLLGHQHQALSTAVRNKIKTAAFDVVKLPVRITHRNVGQELKVLRTLSEEGTAGGWMAEESRSSRAQHTV